MNPAVPVQSTRTNIIAVLELNNITSISQLFSVLLKHTKDNMLKQ